MKSRRGAGEQAFFALLEKCSGFDSRLRRGFTDRELVQLRRVLDRLTDNVTSPDDSDASSDDEARLMRRMARTRLGGPAAQGWRQT